MAEKKDTPVIINGKVYTLSGYESEEYLQSVALYINNKITECKGSEHYRKLNAEHQGVLLALNIADDYFKVRKQAESSEKQGDEKEKQLYDLRHEVIETRIKQESALKLVEEYKEQVNALQRKIIQLEAEHGRNQEK